MKLLKRLIVWLAIPVALFYFYVALCSPWKIDADQSSTMYSHKFGGTRIGLLFSCLEQNKIKSEGSGSVSIIWLKEKSYWEMRAKQFSAR